MGKYIGIDLGGTKIAGVVVDSDTQQYYGQMVISTEAKSGPDAVLKRIADFVRQIAEREGISAGELSGVGVGFPAAVDYDKGQTLVMPNLPGNWYQKPVVEIIEGHLQRSVLMINDARAFTLAEATLGAGRGADTVACFTLGTGIGGGIAINGRLHMGLAASAGEFGHTSINFDGQPDGSGARGGLESYASGPAIAAMGMKAVMQGITTKIGELAEYDLNRITPELIMQAAEAGDAIACDIMERAGRYLGFGVANVVTILAPDRVVLGGGVTRLGDWILKPMMRTLAEQCPTVPIDRMQVVYATLGGDAGAIGAALWAAARQT